MAVTITITLDDTAVEDADHPSVSAFDHGLTVGDGVFEAEVEAAIETLLHDRANLMTPAEPF